eukprot:5025021-Pleurochrysis_carterae.AAC.2
MKGTRARYTGIKCQWDEGGLDTSSLLCCYTHRPTRGHDVREAVQADRHSRMYTQPACSLNDVLHNAQATSLKPDPS